jgi:hypothetical protein
VYENLFIKSLNDGRAANPTVTLLMPTPDTRTRSIPYAPNRPAEGPRIMTTISTQATFATEACSAKRTLRSHGMERCG